MTARRRRLGLVLAGAVVVLGGVGVGVVEVLRLPRGSVWIVVAATVGLVALIRSVTAGRRE
jgi:hypothetical protein